MRVKNCKFSLHKHLASESTYLFIIIVISSITQVLYIRPPELSDQMRYYRAAVTFPHLPDIPNHWTMRLGLILPVAILYRIFGHCELTYYALPVLSTVVFMISTFLIGKHLFNKQVGLISSLWIIWTPYFLLESGNLLPDITASACISLAFAILLNNKLDQRGKYFSFVVLLAGTLFGWAYITKEYFAFFAILIPILFWYRDFHKKHLITFSLGVLIIVAIEFTTFAIAYGDPFVRFLTIEPRETFGLIEKNPFKIFLRLFLLLSKYKGFITVLVTSYGLIWLSQKILKKSRKHIFLFCWISVVYILFITSALLPVIYDWKDRVLLRIHIFRYWIPMLPPLFISAVAAIENLLNLFIAALKKNDRFRQNIISLLLFGLLTTSSILQISSIHGNSKFVKNDSSHFLELRQYLCNCSDNNETIWIIRESSIGYEYILQIYSHDLFGKKIWFGTPKYLNTENEFVTTDQLTSGKIIIDCARFNPDFHDIPIYLKKIPSSWKREFESNNGRIAVYEIK